MKRVTGIGGVFFRAENPAQLRAWYQQYLGLEMDSVGTIFQDRETGPGYTLWAPFDSHHRHIGQGRQSFMINFRVEDLDGLLEDLERQGVPFDGAPVVDDFGKFAWIVDPEGNTVELWEPTGTPSGGEEASAMAELFPQGEPAPPEDDPLPPSVEDAEAAADEPGDEDGGDMADAFDAIEIEVKDAPEEDKGDALGVMPVDEGDFSPEGLDEVGDDELEAALAGTSGEGDMPPDDGGLGDFALDDGELDGAEGLGDIAQDEGALGDIASDEGSLFGGSPEDDPFGVDLPDDVDGEGLGGMDLDMDELGDIESALGGMELEDNA